MFQPTLGRWMQEDPIGLAGGDVNLYGAERNDPITGDDPSGLQDPKRPPWEYDPVADWLNPMWGPGGLSSNRGPIFRARAGYLIESGAEGLYDLTIGPIYHTGQFIIDVPLAAADSDYEPMNATFRGYLKGDIGYGKAVFGLTADATAALGTVGAVGKLGRLGATRVLMADGTIREIPLTSANPLDPWAEFRPTEPKLWDNWYFGDKANRELAQAAALDVRPTRITCTDSVAEIGADGRAFKWVVSQDGELIGVPKVMPGDAIKHSVPTAGAPVQAAGNARVQGTKIIIDRRSGHYRPDEASLQIAKQKLEAAGFSVEIVEDVTSPSGK